MAGNSHYLLTLTELRRKNIQRQKDWATSWDAAQWGNATSGEVGEAIGAYLALLTAQHAGEADNLAKKIIRFDQNIAVQHKQNIPRAELVNRLAAEMADVLAYLDLWADSQGIDLAKAYIEKFNKKSDEIGSKVKFE